MLIICKRDRVELSTPQELPRASAYLWNKKMMVNVNCRGYVATQFMQADASKYSYAPNIEAKTFMQPEQAYYAHHPGRFVYIKDEETGDVLSLPYEPTRKKTDYFIFSAGISNIFWRIQHRGIEYLWKLQIPIEDVVEMWSLQIRNTTSRAKTLNIYPYFTIGYMSWMNQSAYHNDQLGALVASRITPYQKLEDYSKIKNLKDKTYLLYESAPLSWETSQGRFEGEGGLHQPNGINSARLSQTPAMYETPLAALHYQMYLTAGEEQQLRFLFGPARDDQEIADIRTRYLSKAAFSQHATRYNEYQSQSQGVIDSRSPDEFFDNFINRWLPRQIYYHGDINRLSNDPQTRNYLQDGMGMAYLKPEVTRNAILVALSQQEKSGAMPDGILLRDDATLQYINQIPHTDHCLWLPVCLTAYLDETDDYQLLNTKVIGRSDQCEKTVFDRITAALMFLLENRDERGLSFIAQGDWCDPMNMVGHKGKGVSGWLSIATIYALKSWATICEKYGEHALAHTLLTRADELTAAVNHYLWDGNWFARGITDDGVSFGIKSDKEGKIYLNPQSWAIMAGCIDEEQHKKIMAAVDEHLATPYGLTMLAPAYTGMREDVGRVTQKYPGTAENGSVYNHAMIFYVFALYLSHESDRAFALLKQMLPGPESEDYLKRGQLPIFIPNYYRGAYHQHPEVAGKSSQLFNTGTVSWYYRCVIEGLYGLKGCREGLGVQPQLPSNWQHAHVERRFRGALFRVNMVRKTEIDALQVIVDGNKLDKNVITEILPGKNYSVDVSIPVHVKA